MKMRINKIKSINIYMTLLLISLLSSGCVNQNPDNTANNQLSSNAANITMSAYNSSKQDFKVAATSVAVMQICESLNISLVGIPESSLVEIPDCYKEAVSLGSPMSPDMEILSTLSPDWVLSPSSLKNDLIPKYEAANLNYAFLNLKSVSGMYKSIFEMGELFNRQQEAAVLLEDFNEFYNDYQLSHIEKNAPTVLILMGLPGSYVVATENSYVGNLVEIAGGINVYSGSQDEFLNINTEDMLTKNSDIILRTAHAMPDSVMEMFAEEFAENDIWKHFSAVTNGQVYDLPYESCGMSANFHYKEALELLDTIFYGTEQGDTK